MKVYLSGPMSWRPAFNFPAFDAAAAELRSYGVDVISPVELDNAAQQAVSRASVDGNPDTYATHGLTREQFLARDAAVIVAGGLDAIVGLPDWEDSDGACFEIGVGQLRGIPFIEYGELLARLPIPGPSLKAYLGQLLIGGRASVDERTIKQDAATFGAQRNRKPTDQQRIDAGEIPGVDFLPAEAVKADNGKPRLDLLPAEALLGTAAVLGFGATKYADNNWRRGFAWSRIYGAALRHLIAWGAGEDLDPESGLNHLDHASCDVMFLQTFAKTGTGTDDRYKPRG